MAKLGEANIGGRLVPAWLMDGNASAIDFFESTEYPSCIYRKLADGTVEWINPPMVLGVEYRTIERHLGNPVYTKIFDFGALPNNTSKDLLLTGLGIHDVIYLSGCVSNNVLEPSALSGYIVSRYADNQRIRIITNGDASAYSAVVVLKYTKITD